MLKKLKKQRFEIGWANETKMAFFYGHLVACGLAVLLCAIITFNISTPQTRKDSVVEQLSSQSTGLTIMVMIYAMVRSKFTKIRLLFDKRNDFLTFYRLGDSPFQLTSGFQTKRLLTFSPFFKSSMLGLAYLS